MNIGSDNRARVQALDRTRGRGLRRSEDRMTVDRIEATIYAINAEHEAMKQAEARQDADAWCGAIEARDALLDDLVALYEQRRRHVSVGLAPAL